MKTMTSKSKKISKKKVKKKPIKKKDYIVEVTVTIAGHFFVKAKSEKDAEQMARQMIDIYDIHYGIQAPCIFYDYETYEDIEEQEENDD